MAAANVKLRDRAFKAATFKKPDSWSTLAANTVKHGTGNALMDRFFVAAAVTLAVAAILLIFRPPMIMSRNKKKYHLPSPSFARMAVYLSVSFVAVIILSYIPA
jgi:hypothetical protein